MPEGREASVVVDKIGRVWQRDDKTLWPDQQEPYWRCWQNGGRGTFYASLDSEWGPLIRLVPEGGAA